MNDQEKAPTAKSQKGSSGTEKTGVRSGHKRSLKAANKSILQHKEERQSRFLAAYTLTGSRFQAGIASEVPKQTVTDWMKDPVFVDRFEEAKKEAADNLEIEARRRAIEGVRRLKFYKGKPVVDPVTGEPYVEHEYSDTLLIVLLKANDPEKFGDKISILKRECEKLSDDELRKIIDSGRALAGADTSSQ